MNLVLVCLVNFQEYILQNIEQLIVLGHQHIYVLTNTHLFPHFSQYVEKITLISVNSFEESMTIFNKHYKQKDNQFRNGFWSLTSLRFFYINEFMRKYNIENVIHLENDVLIYYNCNVLFDKVEKSVYLPFDTFNRNIASIMYIPNHTIFSNILHHYNHSKNDMENFSEISRKTNLIRRFPIFIQMDGQSPEEQFVSTEFDLFSFLFDAAAMGQYLGGIDPRNQSGDTRGFINEICVIKYNQYTFEWLRNERNETGDNITRPFIIIQNKKYPIFNLHIHSKNLGLWRNQFSA